MPQKERQTTWVNTMMMNQNTNNFIKNRYNIKNGIRFKIERTNPQDGSVRYYKTSRREVRRGKESDCEMTERLVTLSTN
jgi:hypothetical protein